jgi:hypothetical protein
VRSLPRDDRSSLRIGTLVPMQNEDMRWIVKKLVTLKAETEALRKLLLRQHEQMSEFAIVEDWKNGAPPGVFDILSDIEK